MTTLELLLATLAEDPSRIVVGHRGRGITGRAFLGRARAMAVHLRSAGLREGDSLGVATADNVTSMQLLLAAWMCGAAPLVLDFRLSARQLGEWHRRLPLRLVVGPGTAASPEGPPVLALPPDLPPLDDLPWAPPSDEGAVADFFTSSGTTNFPKILPVTHGSMAATINRWLHDPALGILGVTLSALSLAYPGSRTVWYRNLVAGQKIVALDLIHTLRELDEALARPDVQDCTLPPVQLRRLAQLPPKGEGPRYPQLQKLRAIGGPSTPEDKLLAVQRLSPNYLMTYSSTDAGVVSRIVGAEVLERPASCGRPVPGTTVEIRDGDRLCPPGETGVIRVLREGQDPVEPGDLGWLDRDGYLYIAGRTGGLMCRHGINVSVAQVESVLLACPQVADAVVWPTPDEDEGDRIHAVLECAEGDEAAIREFIRRDVSNRERPDRVAFARRLPRTPGGKPDRRAIAETFAERAPTHA